MPCDVASSCITIPRFTQDTDEARIQSDLKKIGSSLFLAGSAAYDYVIPLLSHLSKSGINTILPSPEIEREKGLIE